MIVATEAPSIGASALISSLWGSLSRDYAIFLGEKPDSVDRQLTHFPVQMMAQLSEWEKPGRTVVAQLESAQRIVLLSLWNDSRYPKLAQKARRASNTRWNQVTVIEIERHCWTLYFFTVITRHWHCKLNKCGQKKCIFLQIHYSVNLYKTAARKIVQYCISLRRYYLRGLGPRIRTHL